MKKADAVLAALIAGAARGDTAAVRLLTDHHPEAGRLVTIELRAALFKALVARAIKGDARSAALVIRLMEHSVQPAKNTGEDIRRLAVGPLAGSQRRAGGGMLVGTP